MKAINISWGNAWLTRGINICFLSEVMLCYWLRGTAYCWLQAGCYWIFGMSQSLYMLLWIVCESRPLLFDSLWPHGLYSPWDFVPFSRGSSQPRDRTQVSRIAGRFVTSWATRILEWVTFPFSSIFQTQEVNWGLLHCRRILYRVIRGAPAITEVRYKSCAENICTCHTLVSNEALNPFWSNTTWMTYFSKSHPGRTKSQIWKVINPSPRNKTLSFSVQRKFLSSVLRLNQIYESES